MRRRRRDVKKVEGDNIRGGGWRERRVEMGATWRHEIGRMGPWVVEKVTQRMM